MRQRPVIICLALALITLGVYAPVLHNSFVNFDDQAYVTDNPHVQAGLTTSGVAWAFSSAGYASNWHPLTWISHMLDCQFFGLNPAGHHAVNVIFHAVNTVLLFLLLSRMTGALWRSALVAALFAWHPLHVESVAWVSERKDVLSAFFCLLALLAYVAFAERSKVQSPRSKVLYGLALALFACGLMSKPMLVTLPLVMLLMDFWPLRRIADPRLAIGDLKSDENSVIEKVSLKRALLEKAPFLALALISSVLTIVAQHAGGSVASLSRLPILTRVSMALVSYCRYIAKTVWPENLSAYYPPVAGWPSWMILTSAIFLAAVSVYCWRARRTEPYLVIGWTWFLVMLVPVIGLVQVGTQAMADRYTYLPAIGLFIIAAWELERLSRKAPQMKMALTAASGVALAVCLFLSRERVFDWRNSGTLFAQSLRVAPVNNFMAHALLGSFLNDQGRFVDAEPHFVEALKVAPTFPIAQYGMGNSLLAQQKWTNAAEHFSRAIEYSPGYAEAHFGRGTTYLVRGNSEMALADFEEAVRLKPNWPAALNNLAWILATATDAKYRNGARAVHLAERACKLAGNRQPLYLGTLAAAYAEAGQFKEAIATGEKASELALAAGEKSVSEKNLQLLELYRANKPYHEPPPQPATPQN